MNLVSINPANNKKLESQKEISTEKINQIIKINKLIPQVLIVVMMNF